MSNLNFEQLRDITGGRLGIIDAACPECGPQRRTTINQRRKVLRVWCDTASFLTYRCARCEIEGHAFDGSTMAERPDPAVLERAKAKAKERERLRQIESLRKSQWFWRQRLPIAGSIGETYIRDRRRYHGGLPGTLGFLPPRGEHGPAMIAAFGMVQEIAPGEIVIDDEDVRGVHITRLKPDGSDKAGADPDKIMLGTTSLGWPIVLAPVNDGLGLAICEGIENALSVHQATGLGAWAAGSADRMAALAAVIPEYVECITVFGDPDERGMTNARRLATALQRSDRDVRLVIPSREGMAA